MQVTVTVTDAVDEAGTLELWPVYDAVFGDQPDVSTWRAAVWDRHVARSGFRLARASSADGLAGFAYGYTGERGQWWSDRAVEVLPPAVAEEWIGGHFELVSVGVLAAARGRGIGERLMTALTSGLPHDRLVLMTTADPADPARGLYARLGWEVIGPGLRDDQVIMGRRRRTG